MCSPVWIRFGTLAILGVSLSSGRRNTCRLPRKTVCRRLGERPEPGISLPLANYLLSLLKCILVEF